MKRFVVIASLITLCFSSQLLAHHVAGHKVDDMPLTKGHARLVMSLSGSNLEIELYTPTINILDFDGKPGSDQEQSALDDALAWLNSANEVFTLPKAAACVAIVSEINSSIIDGKGKSANAKLPEFDGYYVMECEKPSELDQIKVNLFGKYPAIKEIFSKVQGAGKTKRDKLTPANDNLMLN